MNGHPTVVDLGSRRFSRSIAAIAIGFLTVAVLSFATDQLLHMFQVYPPWGERMFAPSLNMLALSYRIVYTVAGGYVTARLAPHGPMGHVWILGSLGLFFGTLSAVATIPMRLGPTWFPIAIAATALPCTWAGGVLHRTWRETRARAHSPE